MPLKEIIDRLAKEDPTRIVRLGWDDAFSYRGDYSELGFRKAENIAIGVMFTVAKCALGKTFTGYKGGEYEMREYTACHLVNGSSETSDDEVGTLLLEALLADRTEKAVPPEVVPAGTKFAKGALFAWGDRVLRAEKECEVWAGFMQGETTELLSFESDCEPEFAGKILDAIGADQRYLMIGSDSGLDEDDPDFHDDGDEQVD
jgi:hypothetical protein